ncbi:hypothetical protein KAH81_07560 [bacterium]|nr:hypothetical protein [bacterium]
MSKKESRFPGSTLGLLTRWTAIAIAVVFIGFNLINLLQYRKIEPALSGGMAQRQIFETQVMASAIRPARIRSYNVDSTGLYASLLVEQIGNFYTQGLFNSISILDTLGNVVLSSQSAYKKGDFYPFVESDRLSFNSALSGMASTTELYKGEGRLIRGSYAPIEDEIGRINWVLSVEAGAEYYKLLADLRRNLLLFGIFSMFVVVAGIIILLSTSHMMRKMERRLIDASKLASMGQMAAGVAHDIRNPLAIIKASTERLSKSSTYAQKEMIDYINEEIARIDRTISEYLSLARPSAGVISPVELGSLVEEIVSKFEPRARLNSVAFNMKLKDKVMILIPVDGVRRAVLNIINNAIEAMPDGGTITINLFVEENIAKLVISDEGRGIDSQIASKIFDPLFTTKTTGTGIGLTIAKKFINSAGGKLELIGSNENGSTFEITFPFQK